MKKIFIISCLILVSVNLSAYMGDGMGDHKAKKNLNMNSHSIIDVDLVDGNDISEIAKSTGDINAVVLSSFGVNDADHNAMRAYTNATRGNVAFITTNTATGYYGYFGSSNSVGLPPTGGGGGGGGGDQWGGIGFYVPGDMFATNGIAYSAPIGFGITLTSAVITVTADGKCPMGAGLYCDIKYSSSTIYMGSGTGLPTFTSVFNSTSSLFISANSSTTVSVDFAVTKFKPNTVFRLDILSIGSTQAGGSPLCVTVYGKKD